MDAEAVDDRPRFYRYGFGSAVYDQAAQTLQVDDAIVEVENRPLQVLERLLQTPGEAVTREELLETVWAGRPTVDNVLPNAVAKLRRALGERNAERLQTVPRVGYRLEGPVERTAQGRRAVFRLALAAGEPVPGRPHWVLVERLSGHAGETTHGLAEVWRARQAKTHELRIFKFAADGEQLGLLKREVTLYRVLRESLGERDDIVRLIDWNFEAPPFFLESEDAGSNLVAWSTDHLAGLAPPARVALLLRIAEATAAAHGAGVLHKDLKPSNVLVQSGPDGADLQLRLGDFGSARLADPARLAALGITAHGMTLSSVAAAADSSGTLAYLAPELLAGKPPSARSDVYALGLMLYQLLAGDLRRPLLPGWERDVPDPLLREDIAAAAELDPAHRLASAEQLCERLRTLDARRAEHAGRLRRDELARDALRQLERTRARRPWVVAAAVLLVAGLGLTLWQYRRAEASARLATRQAEVASAINRFVTDDLIGATQPSTAGHAGTTVIDAVRAAVTRIDDRHDLPPAVLAGLRKTLQITLSELSDRQASVAQGRLALAALAQAGPPPDPGAEGEVRAWMAGDLARLGDLAQANEQLKALAALEPQLLERAPEIALRYYQAQGIALSMGGRNRDASVFDRKAVDLAHRLPGVRPGLLDQLQFNLAAGLITLGEPQKAEADLRELLARQTTRLGATHENTLYTQVLLAHDLLRQHQVDAAEQLIEPAVAGLQTALGAEASRTLMARTVQAGIEVQRGHFVAAAQMYATLGARFEKQDGAASPQAIEMLEGQASALLRAGDAEHAEPLLRRALAGAHQAFGASADTEPLAQLLRFDLADSLLALGRGDPEAATLLADLQPGPLAEADPTSDWPDRLAKARARLPAAR